MKSVTDEARVDDLSRVNLDDLAVKTDAEVDEIDRRVAGSPYFNRDLAPAGPSRRTWSTWNITAMWIGMSVVITTYTLASGLMASGMNWWQALLTITLGNLLVLIPMVLNAHSGVRYGIPFPVFVRASFGIRGANIAAIARALVACGWFGIQTWLGGLALDALLTQLWGGWADMGWHRGFAFAIFWLFQVAIILNGMEAIKYLESWAAPLLLGGGIAVLTWAFIEVGSISEPFSSGPQGQLEKAGPGFWTLFWPSLAANVGYWATLSLNIPDFTRFAQSQRSQAIGQAIGLPLTMAAFSFIGIATTAATIVIYGKPIWDPIALMNQFDSAAVLILAMIVIVAAQVSTNMAANVVAPSNDFSNLWPRVISFRTGGVITAVIGILMFPWKIYEDLAAYIFTWLVGYGSLLGAIAGVMIVDYWLIRRERLELVELYSASPRGRYWYSSGFNWRAIAAVVVAVAPVVPGFIEAATTEGGVVPNPDLLDRFYTYGFGFTFAVAAILYFVLMRATAPRPEPAYATR
ncbi:MAG: NCS1 family nucleobase:cation symporter-1 [Actinomycetota bacterium]|nr:NCS1 family nucleobase:cation symporter-1 [Actinomycetota bacterium]